MHTKTLDHNAVTERVLTYRWLSVQIARRFVFSLPSWVDGDDVQAAADLGLVEAANRFDAGYGVPFVPYAKLRITGAVRDELRARDPLSRSARQQLTQLQRVTQTPTEPASVLPVRSAAPLLAKRGEMLRMDVLQAHSQPALCGVEVADHVQLEEVVLRRERLRFFAIALVALPPRLAVVVPCDSEAISLRTLAARCGVSMSTVSRQRTVARLWLNAAVACYDGVPIVNSQSFTPALQGYLRRVTLQAAATAWSWQVR